MYYLSRLQLCKAKTEFDKCQNKKNLEIFCSIKLLLEFKCHVKRIDFKSARLCLLALIRVCAHSTFSINATEKSNYSFPRTDLRNSYTSAVFTPSPNHLYFYFPLNRMYLSLNWFCQSRSQSSIKFVNMKVFLAIKRNASSTCGFLVSICHVDLQVNSAFLELSLIHI